MREEPVLRVVEAVAEAEGTEPHELDLRLQDHVETDILRQLWEEDTGAWTFSFELPDHEVTVTSDGIILVDEGRRMACL